MEQPQPGALADLVAAVRAIVQQARVAAIADANLRPEGLAEGLGVVLGELTLASEYPYLSPSGTNDCATVGASGEFGPYGPGTDPAFDPDATEVTVTVQVTVTYAIEEATEAS